MVHAPDMGHHGPDQKLLQQDFICLHLEVDMELDSQRPAGTQGDMLTVDSAGSSAEAIHSPAGLPWPFVVPASPCISACSSCWTRDS